MLPQYPLWEESKRFSDQDGRADFGTGLPVQVNLRYTQWKGGISEEVIFQRATIRRLFHGIKRIPWLKRNKL